MNVREVSLYIGGAGLEKGGRQNFSASSLGGGKISVQSFGDSLNPLCEGTNNVNIFRQCIIESRRTGNQLLKKKPL